MALKMETPQRRTAAVSGISSEQEDRNNITVHAPVSIPDRHEDFDWSIDSSVIIPEQPETALYWTSRSQLVIRQRGWPDDDSFVYFNKAMLPRVIEMLQAEAES
jgi:hypothetical protein